MDNQRFLSLEGIHNWRDYGGYAVMGGGCIRRGLLWRGGHQARATDADLLRLGDLGLAHVIDLRGSTERGRHPSRRPYGWRGELHEYDGETAQLAPHVEAAQNALDEQSARATMTKLYADLPQREALNAMLRRYFAVLARGDGPSVVHCAAGKDRTGMAVALLHHLLGVSRADAMADFLLTNSAPDNDRRIGEGMALLGKRYGRIDRPVAEILMSVEPGYLEAAWQAMERAEGSIDAYLHRRLGVDETMRAALRLHLVES